jgi:Flp pilus assembly protein TadD
MKVHSQRKWTHPVALVFLLLCLAGPVRAQISTITDSESQTNLGGMNSIVGIVFAPSGRPLEARVRIRLSTMTRGDRIFTTNNNGAFAFRGLPAGSYTVTIDKEADYKPFSTSVDIIQFRGSPAQTYTLNIRLEFKAHGETKPAVVSAEFLNVPKKAMAHYEAAMERAKAGDRPAAIEELKLAIAEYPSFTAAFNELGVLYLKTNRLEQADQAFQNALKIDAESVPALVNRGIANVMMERYGEAVPILRTALKKDEQSAVGHYFLGQALANLGLFNDAEKELQTSLKLGKEEMKEAHRILAIIYSSRGERKKAADELEAYLKVAPNAPDAEKLRAMIQQLRADPNK